MLSIINGSKRLKASNTPAAAHVLRIKTLSATLPDKYITDDAETHHMSMYKAKTDFPTPGLPLTTTCLML